MSRIKTSEIHLRMLPTEKEEIRQKAEAARLTVTDYIKALSAQKKIYVIEDVPELVVEITRIGTNINQVAAVANAHKTVSEYQIRELKKELKKIQDMLSELLKEIYSIKDDETEV